MFFLENSLKFLGSILGQKWTRELEERYGSHIDFEKMRALKTHEKLYPPGKCLFMEGNVIYNSFFGKY